MKKKKKANYIKEKKPTSKLWGLSGVVTAYLPWCLAARPQVS